MNNLSHRHIHVNRYLWIVPSDREVFPGFSMHFPENPGLAGENTFAVFVILPMSHLGTAELSLNKHVGQRNRP